MRLFVLLGVVLLAGCAQTVEQMEIKPENRAGILKDFGFPEDVSDPGPYTVLVMAISEENTVNPEASNKVMGLGGQVSTRLSYAERATMEHCLRHKKADETCYVIYRGGWIGD